MESLALSTFIVFGCILSSVAAMCAARSFHRSTLAMMEEEKKSDRHCHMLTAIFLLAMALVVYVLMYSHYLASLPLPESPLRATTLLINFGIFAIAMYTVNALMNKKTGGIHNVIPVQLRDLADKASQRMDDCNKMIDECRKNLPLPEKNEQIKNKDSKRGSLYKANELLQRQRMQLNHGDPICNDASAEEEILVLPNTEGDIDESFYVGPPRNDRYPKEKYPSVKSQQNSDKAGIVAQSENSRAKMKRIKSGGGLILPTKLIDNKYNKYQSRYLPSTSPVRVKRIKPNTASRRNKMDFNVKKRIKSPAASDDFRSNFDDNWYGKGNIQSAMHEQNPTDQSTLSLNNMSVKKFSNADSCSAKTDSFKNSNLHRGKDKKHFQLSPPNVQYNKVTNIPPPLRDSRGPLKEVFRVKLVQNPNADVNSGYGGDAIRNARGDIVQTQKHKVPTQVKLLRHRRMDSHPNKDVKESLSDWTNNDNRDIASVSSLVRVKRVMSNGNTGRVYSSKRLKNGEKLITLDGSINQNNIDDSEGEALKGNYINVNAPGIRNKPIYRNDREVLVKYTSHEDSEELTPHKISLNVATLDMERRGKNSAKAKHQSCDQSFSNQDKGKLLSQYAQIRNDKKIQRQMQIKNFHDIRDSHEGPERGQNAYMPYNSDEKGFERNREPQGRQLDNDYREVISAGGRDGEIPLRRNYGNLKKDIDRAKVPERELNGKRYVILPRQPVTNNYGGIGKEQENDGLEKDLYRENYRNPGKQRRENYKSFRDDFVSTGNSDPRQLPDQKYYDNGSPQNVVSRGRNNSSSSTETDNWETYESHQELSRKYNSMPPRVPGSGGVHRRKVVYGSNKKSRRIVKPQNSEDNFFEKVPSDAFHKIVDNASYQNKHIERSDHVPVKNVQSTEKHIRNVPSSGQRGKLKTVVVKRRTSPVKVQVRIGEMPTSMSSVGSSRKRSHVKVNRVYSNQDKDAKNVAKRDVTESKVSSSSQQSLVDSVINMDGLPKGDIYERNELPCEECELCHKKMLLQTVACDECNVCQENFFVYPPCPDCKYCKANMQNLHIDPVIQTKEGKRIHPLGALTKTHDSCECIAQHERKGGSMSHCQNCPVNASPCKNCKFCQEKILSEAKPCPDCAVCNKSLELSEIHECHYGVHTCKAGGTSKQPLQLYTFAPCSVTLNIDGNCCDDISDCLSCQE